MLSFNKIIEIPRLWLSCNFETWDFQVRDYVIFAKVNVGLTEIIKYVIYYIKGKIKKY